MAKETKLTLRKPVLVIGSERKVTGMIRTQGTKTIRARVKIPYAASPLGMTDSRRCRIDDRIVASH